MQKGKAQGLSPYGCGIVLRAAAACLPPLGGEENRPAVVLTGQSKGLPCSGEEGWVGCRGWWCTKELRNKRQQGEPSKSRGDAVPNIQHWVVTKS